MQGTSGPEDISTRLQRTAELARKAPTMVLTTLAHHIDLELMLEAYRKTRKDGAPGIDGQTATEYAANLVAIWMCSIRFCFTASSAMSAASR